MVHAQDSGHEIISSGIDWITCTGTNGPSSLALENIYAREREKQNAQGKGSSPARLFGYVGYKSDGLFFGRRPNDVCLIASGASCTPLSTECIRSADNVSRLDLQFTVWTGGAEEPLAHQIFKSVKQERTRGRGLGSVTLLTTHPEGDTVTFNRRISDSYGRVYDKGVESKCGPPRTIWRFEVEFKRRWSKLLAKHLSDFECDPALVAGIVRHYFLKKAVLPQHMPTSSASITLKLPPRESKRSIPEWLESSISQSVRKGIDEFGLDRILSSLGLTELLR